MRVYDFYSMKYIYFQDTVTKDIINDSVLRAIQSVEYTNEIEAVKNTGGDAAGPWMIEGGQPDPQLNMVVTEIRAGLYSAVEDSTITTNAAETGGSVGAIANTSGVTIQDGTNGIVSVAASSTNQANLQAGTYIFKIGSGAGLVNIYGASLAPNLTDINNLLAEDVDCSTPGTVEVAAAGITLTVAGVPAFVAGDVAVCEDVRPVNVGSNKISIGSSSNPTLKQVTLIQPKQVTGDIYVITIPKLFLPGGLPFGAATREFSEITISGSPQVSDDGSVYEIDQILGST